MAKTNAERQKALRDRRKSGGSHTLRITCSDTERQMIDECCRVRGGLDGKYEVVEYLLTLARLDHDRLVDQRADLAESGPCAKCGQKLPTGCSGLHKGEMSCYHHNYGLALRVTG